MAGPNLEVFKFGVYMFFPVWIMFKFGDPQWYQDYVLPYKHTLWPAYEKTNASRPLAPFSLSGLVNDTPNTAFIRVKTWLARCTSRYPLPLASPSSPSPPRPSPQPRSSSPPPADAQRPPRTVSDIDAELARYKAERAAKKARAQLDSAEAIGSISADGAGAPSGHVAATTAHAFYGRRAAAEGVARTTAVAGNDGERMV